MQAKTRAKIDSDAACLPGKAERIELGSGTIRGGLEVAHHPGVNGAQVMGVMSACSIHEPQRIETGLGKGAAHAPPGQFPRGLSWTDDEQADACARGGRPC